MQVRNYWHGNERLHESRRGRGDLVEKGIGTLIDKKLQRLATGKHDFTLLGDCTERGGCTDASARGVNEHTIVHELRQSGRTSKGQGRQLAAYLTNSCRLTSTRH